MAEDAQSSLVMTLWALKLKPRIRFKKNEFTTIAFCGIFTLVQTLIASYKMRMKLPLTFISVRNTQIGCVGGCGDDDDVSGNGSGTAAAASPAAMNTWGDDVYGLFERV